MAPPFASTDHGIAEPVYITAVGANASASGSGNLSVIDGALTYTPPVIPSPINVYGQFKIQANQNNGSYASPGNGSFVTLSIVAGESNPSISGVLTPSGMSVGNQASGYIGNTVTFTTKGIYMVSLSFVVNPSGNGNPNSATINLLNNNNTIIYQYKNHQISTGKDRIMGVSFTYFHKVLDLTVDSLKFQLATNNSVGSETCILQPIGCQMNISKISNDF